MNKNLKRILVLVALLVVIFLIVVYFQMLGFSLDTQKYIPNFFDNEEKKEEEKPKNTIDLDPVDPVDAIQEEKKVNINHPFNTFFRSIYQDQVSGKSRFQGVMGPCGSFKVGIGNDFQGIINMLIFSIFTNTTVFVQPKALFSNANCDDQFTNYFSFVDPEIQEYAAYPYNPFKELLTASPTGCAGRTPGSLNKLYPSCKTFPSGCQSVIYPFATIGKYNGAHWSDDLVYRICSNHLCKLFFESGEREKIYHDMSGNPHKVHCFPSWEYQFLGANIFRSKAKTRYICDTLDLCETVNRTHIDLYCKNNPCYREGFKVTRNLVRRVFKFNETMIKNIRHLLPVDSLKKKVEIEQSNDGYDDGDQDYEEEVSIGIHCRTVFRNMYKDPLVDINQCLVKMIQDISLERIQGNAKNRVFRIHVAGDSTFKKDIQKHISGIKKYLFDQRSKNIIEFKNVTAGYIDSEISDHSIWRKNSASLRLGAFLDLFTLSLSDYYMLTQRSTFGRIVFFFGQYLPFKNYYILPLAMNFKGGDPNKEFRPCSNSLSLIACDKAHCPGEKYMF